MEKFISRDWETADDKDDSDADRSGTGKSLDFSLFPSLSGGGSGFSIPTMEDKKFEVTCQPHENPKAVPGTESTQIQTERQVSSPHSLPNNKGVQELCPAIFSRDQKH